MPKAKRIRVVMRRIGRLPPPANETPQERFIRLASGPTGRVTRLLRDLRLLGNLAGPSYAPTPEMIGQIERIVLAEVEQTFSRFRPKVPPREQLPENTFRLQQHDGAAR